MRTPVNRHLVAFCMPSLCGGGAEKAMADLATECTMLGWDVDMVLLDGKDPDYASELSFQVHVVDLHQKHARTSVHALVRYLEQQHPVALFSTLSHMNCAAAVAARLAPIRTRAVLREADTLLECSGALMQASVSLCYRLADSIVAVSDDVKKALMLDAHLPEERICVIRNSIDVDHVRQLAREEVATSFFEDNVATILGVGRLEPVKDFPTLLKAFAMVHARRRCRLVILGKGSQLMELQRLANDLGVSNDVMFPGFVANPYAWMARSSVFVLSSLREGCPNALLQALACGCGVVATDTPGDAQYLLRDGTLGRLTPAGDVAAMASAIERTLDDKKIVGMQADLEDWLRTFDPRTVAISYLNAAGLPSQPRD